jgi:hypothetical protein
LRGIGYEKPEALNNLTSENYNAVMFPSPCGELVMKNNYKHQLMHLL